MYIVKNKDCSNSQQKLFDVLYYTKIYDIIKMRIGALCVVVFYYL